MIEKGTKAYSVVKGKCPRCHEGDFFKYRISYNPTKITKIHNHCPHCNLKYMIEPSFFYGAMYVNYAITVAISIVAFLITVMVFHLNILQSFVIISIVLIILAPINLRLSRIIWINMFIHYESKKN